MKSFVFSLHALLEMKKTFKDKMQAEHAAAEAALDKALETMACLENTWEKENGKYGEIVKDGISPLDLETYSLYFEELQQMVTVAAQEVSHAQEDVNRKQEALVELFKEIKILEKLRQKQYNEFLSEVKKQENSVSEDILSYNVTESVSEQN